ncbi:hypothetical protein [Methylosinus sp. PW1]|uniref:hypothetical protein n=1 Tax=Methylosinus sp. PW1 TaxID=107636 RepID=UPI000565D138|nr:hypothetical protein [Methylosinus sp. PW1]
MVEWNYGGAHLRHDMTGIIELPNDSKVQVADLTKELPEFMMLADCLFIDPPCSNGNLRSFHTKADMDLMYEFKDFEEALFRRIETIGPRDVFIEVFKSNKASFIERLEKLYGSVRVHDSFYYNKPANRCWILQASRRPTFPEFDIGGIDEAKAIQRICSGFEFDTIGDLCMGKGLVGKHAYLAGRRFVGTELNRKRLAVLVDFIREQETKKAA